MKSKSITDLPGQPDVFSDGAEAEAFIFVPAPASQTSATNQTSTTNVGPQLYGALTPTEEYTASVQSVSSSAAGTTVAVTNGGMTFDLTFDASAPASFMTGIEQAASMLSAAISDKITVNLNVHYTGTGGGAFAGPSTGMYEDYATIRSDLINQASPGDTTFNALVNTSSIAGQSLVAVWNSQLKALGLMSPTNAATDGSATFATDINPSLLIGVALHELTHALGRVPYGSASDIFDLYRFTSPGVQLFTGGNTAVASYFSVDGGHTDLADYGLHSDPSDFLNPGPTFLGGPYSTLTPGDPFNELYGNGTLQSLTAVDKKLLDALGFHLTSANGISVTATSAQAVQGGAAVGLLNGSPVITDSASTTLSGATIKVSAAAGNIFPGDELLINGAQSGVVDGGRVTVSWNDSTKILTLAGVASIADYQTLLSEISYQWTGVDSSTGSHTPHTVTWTVNDGTWNLGTTSLITIERPPVATVANVVLNPNATTVAASSLLTASDPDADSIATYAFKDTGNGHFFLNGVAQPNNQEIDVTAAQLSLLTYQTAGGIDSVQARVSDGTLWSSWQPFTITGPAATVIHSDGSTSLVQVGNNFYLNSAATGTGPELKFSGSPFLAGQLGGAWAPIGAVATAGGYDVAWKDPSSGQYTVWSTDSNGSYIANIIGTVPGNNASLEVLETTFHQDLNGDGVIGVPPIVIEAFGSTSMVQSGNNFYLDNISSGVGPTLKYGGVAVVTGQFGGWTPIGAEATTAGYEVAWKVAGADQYVVWNTDSSGNSVSTNVIGVVSGTNSTLESLETSFHQDLNGDGVIGPPPPPPPTVIEAFGSTSLTEVANQYYLYANGTSTGPSLKFSGAGVVAGMFGTWTPIGAEATTAGYEVAWKVAGADQYVVWNTDSSGNSVSTNVIGVVSGTNSTLESLETSFHQDLNGDGVIGPPPPPPPTVIESFGSTSLTEVANQYYLYANGTSTGPSLKFSGAGVVAGMFGTWTPIGAEATTAGYEVAWKVAGADQYLVWNTDSNGNYLSNATDTVSGTSAALESLETSFHQDLNGDGVIGPPPPPPPTVIESFGSTSLTEVANQYYLYANGTSTGPSLKFSGAGVVAGMFGTWTPIGAEATTAGYEVAWKVAGADQYLVWNTDSNGNYLSNATDTVSGTSAALESLETSFHQDLNGDGVIGLAVHAGAMLELTDVYSGLVTFSSPTGTLKLDAPSTFNGQIAGFTGDGTLSGSDQIDLGNMTFNNSIQSNSTYNNSTGLLTMANGTTVDLLHFVGSYSLANFKFANDGHGGTIVYDPPVTAEGEASDAAIHVTGSSTLGGSILAGANQDTFVFKPNFGQATIENFKLGADSIHIDSAVFADMAALLAMAYDDSHGNVVITDAAHDILTIQNVTSAQVHLHQDAFHFV